MAYIDTYLSCDNEALLENFVASFKNYIPIQKGRAEQTITDENGDESLLPGAGDPSLYYTCIRSDSDFSNDLPTTIAIVSPEVGMSVVGVFA